MSCCSLPEKSLKALVSLGASLGASKQISRPMDLSVKVRGDEGIELLPLFAISQTVVTSVLNIPSDFEVGKVD